MSHIFNYVIHLLSKDAPHNRLYHSNLFFCTCSVLSITCLLHVYYMTVIVVKKKVKCPFLNVIPVMCLLKLKLTSRIDRELKTAYKPRAFTGRTGTVLCEWKLLVKERAERMLEYWVVWKWKVYSERKTNLSLVWRHFQVKLYLL